MARRSRSLPIRPTRTSAPSVMLRLTTPAKLYSSDFSRTSAREFLLQGPLKITQTVLMTLLRQSSLLLLTRAARHFPTLAFRLKIRSSMLAAL